MLSRLHALLFWSIPGFTVVAVHTDGEAIRIEVRCTPADAICPDCSHRTKRVHSSYLRFPADLPTVGRIAELALRVRRFLCTTATCSRRTLVEQVPGLTRRHGGVTERLRHAMGAIGLALAGRAGARLAQIMGITTSRTTLLRRVMDDRLRAPSRRRRRLRPATRSGNAGCLLKIMACTKTLLPKCHLVTTG
ncbi:transposase family protein [Streptomyces sp. NPDC001002]